MMLFAQVKETVEVASGAIREFGVTVVMLAVLVAILIVSMYLFAKYIVLPMKDRHFIFLDATSATNSKLADIQAAQSPKMETVHLSLLDLHRKVDSVARNLKEGKEGPNA